MSSTLPLLLEPQTLAERLGESDLLIVDLGKSQVYQQAHIPGAVHLDFRALQKGTQPAPGCCRTRVRWRHCSAISV